MPPTADVTVGAILLFSLSPTRKGLIHRRAFCTVERAGFLEGGVMTSRLGPAPHVIRRS